jgi:hypothetical protein
MKAMLNDLRRGAPIAAVVVLTVIAAIVMARNFPIMATHAGVDLVSGFIKILFH